MTMLHHTRLIVGIVAGMLAGLSAVPLPAQEASPAIRAGTRIRIAAPAAGIPYRAKGVVDSANADLLFVRNLSAPASLQGNVQVSVPMGQITRLDVRTGQRSRSAAIGTGALIGLAAGALIPVGLALATGSVNEPDSWGWGGVAMGIAGIVPWTFGIGAAVGALLPVDRWQRVIPGPR